MDYRLIAMDLDGTLLRDDLTISARVQSVVQSAQQRGMHIVLASGRAYPAMQRWVQELCITTPVICYQGAMVSDPHTHQRLFARTFSRHLVGELCEFGREHQISVILYVNDVLYVENKLHSDEFYAKWFGIPYQVVDDLTKTLPTEPIKGMFIGSREQLDLVGPEAQSRFGARLQVVRSHPLFLETLAQGVNKGSGLTWVAERLGVPRAETIAIGDSDNDREMIIWAGLGVAMGNATPETKRVADYIAPGVDEDGVAEAIERFCLRG